MSAELEAIRYQEEKERVVSLFARGVRMSEIQKQTGLTRKQVDRHLEEYRDWAKNDKFMINRSREIVLVVDKHYSDIIDQMYEAIEEAKVNEDYKARMQGLKDLAKLESDRVEFLRKAGVVAENNVGSIVAEAEEKQEILVGILKKIAQKYPDVGKEIAFELSQVTGEVEPVRTV